MAEQQRTARVAYFRVATQSESPGEASGRPEAHPIHSVAAGVVRT